MLLRRSTGRPTPSHVASTERWLLLDCVDRDVVDRLRRSNFGPLATPHQLYPGNWAQPRLTVLHTTIFWLDSTAEERSSSSLRPTAPDRQQLQQQLQQHASLLWTFIVCVPLSHAAVLLCFGRGRRDGAVARAHSSLCVVYFRLALPQYTL